MNFIDLTLFSVVQHLHSFERCKYFYQHLHSFERFKYFLREQWLMLSYLALTHFALQSS